MTRKIVAGSAILLLLAEGACARNGEHARFIASGHVEATEVRIAAKVGGRLIEFGLEEGDEVHVDQLLARVDTTDIELALAAARAERDAARADLQLKTTGARPEDIAEARAHVAQVRAELAGAQRDLDRMQQLLDSGSGTIKARDDALTRRDALVERLAAAGQALERLEAGFREEEIAAARARVAGADARIAQFEQQIADATVTSPVTGVITEKTAEQGELLAPGALIAVVTDLADAWLTIYVPAPDVPRLRLGQDLEVVTDDGQRRTGRVAFLASQAEFTPKNVQTREERAKLVYRVKIALPNADGLFKPGMPAEAVLPAPGADS